MKQTIEEAEKEYCEKNYPYSDLKLLVENAFEAGAEWQSKQSTWISVKDKLPPFEKKVLLFNKGVNRVELQYFKKGYDIRAFCAWYCISHWRLADLPK
ncbi:hypothetical protein [Bacteroides fragilis]|uniref:hypothetical protein n=1 Tax=Bacteroides fragilis TaxID=817 RepID=UPI00202F2B39|nr:hypothetical protein [Bacteroides fragilis]MCM0314279.1 hypothetical protein [Bacteroides fragilis]